MYKYLVAFVLLTPLAGIWLVEGGEYAASVGIDGYPNGASLAYGAYALLVVATAWLCAGRRTNGIEPIVASPAADAQFRRVAGNLIVFDAVFLAVFLFGFGAINVWSGGIGKGEFRTGLGALGAIPNLMTKFIVPALLAYAAALYCASSRRTKLKRLLAVNFALAFIIGASWGFKSTAFMVLMPALVLLYWKVRVQTLLKLVVVFLVGVVLFFQFFDADVEVYADVQTFLLRRITVLQGDVAWYIWGQYSEREPFPAYAPTLLAAFGDTTLTLFGLSREDYFTWVAYHYDLMITQLAGVSLDQIEGGHSITATPFAEGLVAAGLFGVVIFALFGGILVGTIYRFIERSRRRGREAHAAVAATYFCFHVFGWLNGGAIVQLFHVSLLISLGVTLLALTAMRRLQLTPVRRLAAA